MEILNASDQKWPRQEEVDTKLEKQREVYVRQLMAYHGSVLDGANVKEKEAYNRIMNKMLALPLPKYDVKRYRQKIISLMDQTFSVEELRQIKAFVTSGVYKKFTKITPMLDKMSNKYAKGYENQLKEMFKKYTRQLEEQVAKIKSRQQKDSK